MDSPRKPKYRKQQKKVRHLKGVENRGNKLDFGDIGLMAIEGAWITSRQLEAGRVAYTRATKRAGKYWTRVFPQKPLTKKPAETRMGKGKGPTDSWVAEVRAGRIIYEITGVPLDQARRGLELAASKMPVKCKIITRSDYLLAS